MKQHLLLLTLTTALAACGGGGDGTDSTAAASIATATAIAATQVTANNATSSAYNLVADIGDSWKINFDTSANAYTVTMLAPSQFGLSNSSSNTSGAFTSSVSGSLITYTLGSAGSITVDSRTKSASGNLTIGGKAATVAGTNYNATALANLAGTYNFVYATRNQSSGLDKDRGLGELKISSNGTTAILCTSGKVNANDTCDEIVTGVTPELNALTLSLSNGVVVASYAGVEWGRFYVHASDLGTAFLIDRYGVNGSGILRVGSLYAVKKQVLPSTVTAGNGTWKCSQFGTVTKTMTINNGAVSASSGSTGTVVYNQLAGNTSAVTAPGFAHFGATNDPMIDRVNALLLSSSLLIVFDADYLTFDTCVKQ